MLTIKHIIHGKTKIKLLINYFSVMDTYVQSFSDFFGTSCISTINANIFIITMYDNVTKDFRLHTLKNNVAAAVFALQKFWEHPQSFQLTL